MAGGRLMPFAVFLTNDAVRDLDELYDYIALHDAPQKANYVLDLGSGSVGIYATIFQIHLQ
jgi:hypothetical protein